MDNTMSIEVVMFKAKANTSDGEVLAAIHATQAELVKFPGYIRRESMKNPDGQWIDMVHWRSLADAQNAAEQFMATPAGQQIMAVVDEQTINMLHLEQVVSFN